MSTRIEATVCPHDCPDRCSVLVTLRDNEVVKVSGDPEHPSTAGFLCGKVTKYSRRLHSQERILTPLRRVGPKGSGQFAAISWDEAIESIAQKVVHLQSSGLATAISHYQGTGSLGVLAENASHALVQHWGGTVQVGSICAGEASAGWRAGAGSIGSSDLMRVEAAETIVLWGCNAAVSTMHFFSLARAAQARGAKLIVIDPYETLTARKADLYLKPFPGTDGALAMGLCHILHERGAWDDSYLAAYSDDAMDFSTHLADYNLTAVAALTRIPEAEILALADILAASPQIFFRVGVGMTRHSFGGHAVWAIASLATVRGVFRHPGGGMLAITGAKPEFNSSALFPPGVPARTTNVAQLAQSLTQRQDPAIQLLLIVAGNPAATSPEQRLLRQGLLRDDLLVVVHEQFLTDTTDYADIVLPAAMFLEHDDWHDSYGSYDYQRQRQVVAPRGEAVSSYEFCRRLALATGLDASFFAKTEAEALVAIHAASSLPWDYATLADGRAHRLAVIPEPDAQGFGNNGFAGRFQFRRPDFLSRDLPERPGHYASDWGPQHVELPFHVMSPPTMEILNASFAGISDGFHKQKLSPAQLVLLHPDDAKALAIQAQELVELRNSYGSIRRYAVPTPAVQKGLLVLEGVYWEKHLDGLGGVNQLSSERRSALAGVPTFHEVRASLHKV